MKRKIIIEAICFLLIFLFAYTGASKLIDHNVFSLQLYQAPVLSKYREAVSLILPISELLVATLLAIKLTRLIALYVSLIMLVTFTIYLAGMLLFSKNLPCHCGGVISQMTWQQHLVFNLFFIILTMTGILLMLNGDPKKLKQVPV